MEVSELGLTFGLPSCLWIPIAAARIDSIERHVGRVVKSRSGKDGRINALLVESHEVPVSDREPILLWTLPNAEECWECLHPKLQVWVHVDFSGYRKAYEEFGMPPIPNGFVLDHVQNRKAVRLRGYSHPYLRLCPIAKATNTNAGGFAGSEGLERQHIGSIASLSEEWQAEIARVLAKPIQLADPADLTKMLNISPGTHVLDGVRDFQHHFYEELADLE